MPKRTSLGALSASAMLLVSLGLAGCEPNQSRAQNAPPPPPKVTVAKPTKRLLADHDEYVGRFVAVDAIEVRARVSGYLDAIHFKDGQLVKKGDLLFSIDRRPFEASLAQAEANLTQARANLAYAEADLERGQGLVRGNTITQQTFDQRTQAKRAYRETRGRQRVAAACEIDRQKWPDERSETIDERAGVKKPCRARQRPQIVNETGLGRVHENEKPCSPLVSRVRKSVASISLAPPARRTE